MTDAGMLSRLGQALLDVLEPLRRALQSPEGFEALMRRQGWLPPPTPAYFPVVSKAFGAQGDLENAATALAALLSGDQPDAGEVVTAVDAVTKVVTDLRALTRPAGTLPAPFDRDEFWTTFPGDLFADLFTRYLEIAQPALFAPLHLLGILDEEQVAADGTPGRIAFTRSKVEWNRLVTMVSDPASLGRDVYGWGADFKHGVLTGRLERVLLALGVSAGRYVPGRSLSDIYYGSAPPPDIVRELRVPLVEERRDDVGFVRVGLTVLPVPPSGSPSAAPAGFFIGPYVYGQASARAELGGPLALELKGGLENGGVVGIEVRPGELRAHLGIAETELDLEIAIAFEPGELCLLLGSEDSHRIQLGNSRLGLSLTGPAASPDLQLTLKTESLSLIFDPSQGDGFVTDLFGTDPKTAQLAGGLEWSSQTGLHWTGTAGLSLSIPVHTTIGPLTIQGIRLAIETVNDDVSLTVAVSGGAAVGPVQAVVADIGVQLTLVPVAAPARGVFGDLDLQFGFKPPRGVGLGVDAAVLRGGGFVDRDPASGRYSGALDLHLEKIGITALGLIDTKLPAGRSGYALLLALSATFPAIQIGLGFALTGVGGLLALNRRVDVDALRGRLAAGTAGRILAPQDPVRNAPALLADLDQVFPVAPGITVVGPTVQLLWAGLVHLDVGVFIELPGPARVVMLGSAHADIERDGRAYLNIRVDIVGVVDLRAQTAAFDAALVDSHLMGMLDLTGGAAFRLSWGAQPYAVLSLGGFNPAYHPEPLAFPATLAPIAMVYGTPSDELYLRFEGYFAVTSNTLQFGASVEALIHSGGFTVHGTVGFDALIQFVPFHFQFDIRASVSVAYGGQTLAGLTLTGSLSGPGPVVLQAKVCIELLFFDICFSGTFPLGPSAPPPAPVAADLLDLLLGELADPARLRAAGPPDPYVRLAPPGPSPAAPVVAPSGTLVWEQQRAPLDLLLTRVGGSPLPAPAQVTATSAAGSAAQSDWFAPGQFTDLTGDQALTRPAYELLTSGLQLAGAATVDGPAAQRTLTTLQIRLPANVTTPGKPVAAFPAWIVTSAAPPAVPAITVGTERWIVTTPAGELGGLTGAQARQLATLTPGARAIPAADQLAPLAF